MQTAKCKLQIKNCRAGFGSDRAANFLLPAPGALLTRSGVTLVELMIVIMIIAVLAGMILGVASVAGETAREAHSRHMVTRLHTLLMEHMDTYKSRRVRLRPQVVSGVNAMNLSASAKGQYLARARLFATRELVMMEMPDRWSDIALTAPEKVSANGTPTIKSPFFQDPAGTSTSNGRSELAGALLRRYIKAAQTAPNVEALVANEGAECLYLIITLACGDGEARTLFHESSIGDTDGDGAPEFLDGWGHPISFLRWAPGFNSEVQMNANLYLPMPPNQAWKTAAAKDHDPFDFFRADPPAFRTVPLIISAGRDESLGIRPIQRPVTFEGLVASQVEAIPNPTSWPLILPYGIVTDLADSEQVFPGTDTGEKTATDNIHNHLLGTR